MDKTYNIDEIQKNAEIIDTETIHMRILNDVASGKFESYFDAFMDFVKEYDIDLDEGGNAVSKYITSSLYGLLYREAMDKSLLKERPTKNRIEDYF